ncbi:unnamed protein product [Schistosoma margrebowiei]|uniref:Uncharacterized protein n=1 Tax=Schistosoma margrebowiei TaxID=48269 RepID=A0A183LY90_9TREM|nr:unnamed protein product [Schistosoma margrebowiei]
MASGVKDEKGYSPTDSFVIRYSIGGSALAQGSVFGAAAILPSKHMKAALEGQAVSGILASLANIVSIAASSSATTNGLVYFLVALIFVTATAALFLVLPKNAAEMKRYNLDVLGIRETYWTRVGQQRLASGEFLLYSGHEEGNASHTQGVALMLSKQAQNVLIGLESHESKPPSKQRTRALQ